MKYEAGEESFLLSLKVAFPDSPKPWNFWYNWTEKLEPPSPQAQSLFPLFKRVFLENHFFLLWIRTGINKEKDERKYSSEILLNNFLGRFAGAKNLFIHTIHTKLYQIAWEFEGLGNVRRTQENMQTVKINGSLKKKQMRSHPPYTSCIKMYVDDWISLS